VQAAAEDPRLQPALQEAGLTMQKLESAIQVLARCTGPGYSTEQTVLITQHTPWHTCRQFFCIVSSSGCPVAAICMPIDAQSGNGTDRSCHVRPPSGSHRAPALSTASCLQSGFKVHGYCLMCMPLTGLRFFGWQGWSVQDKLNQSSKVASAV
jgi:hypothetical protein